MMKKIKYLFVALFLLFGTAYAQIGLYNTGYYTKMNDTVSLKIIDKISPKESFFDKNGASIITGLIAALSTLLVSYLITRMNITASQKNLERQINLQIATTVDKEWIEEMRKNLSEALYIGTKLNVERSVLGDANAIKMYVSRLQELAYIFQVYINSKIPSELSFYMAISSFVRLSIEPDGFQSQEQYDEKYKQVTSTFTEMIYIRLGNV